jgi:hypothetical protein
MYTDVEEWVKTCEMRQSRSKLRFEEGLDPTRSVMMSDKFGVNIVHMPSEFRFFHLIE